MGWDGVKYRAAYAANNAHYNYHMRERTNVLVVAIIKFGFFSPVPLCKRPAKICFYVIVDQWVQS